METLNQYTNYAFISYQRKDEKWAKWLQHKLENYKLPAVARQEQRQQRYIRPVFRDKTDLTGGVLAESLRGELLQSRFLIVICSPNAVQSEWVNSEIHTFIDNGRIERIIPFIVGGEPHADNAELECFPQALRSLQGQQELLGVNVAENGREQAFVRTVAYMLGVRFDELWRRHERRRRRLRLLAAAALLMAALLTLGVYDYQRSQVEYYADWVDRYGVAEGIIPLSDDQVKHRCCSYKFEYRRVPFGEKDFYSWRLHRVSLVNSQGVVVSGEFEKWHPFFYPIQEYVYSDGYVTEIVNRDDYERVTIRYSLKDDYQRNRACLVDMVGKEKHQGSGYLASSTTSLSSTDNSESYSKIKRLHYTRNEQGYITRITYHANDGDELAESAIGDQNNIYGQQFDLDSLGRIVRSTFLNNEGHPVTDKQGVGYVCYAYQQLGSLKQITFLGQDQQPLIGEGRYATVQHKCDEYGNMILWSAYDHHGKPCLTIDGIHMAILRYDTNGFMTEKQFLGTNGRPICCSHYFASVKYKHDARGRVVEQAHFDINGQPCFDDKGVSAYRGEWNAADCIIEQACFDPKGKPCLQKELGVHMVKDEYDSQNYVINEAMFDINEQPCISPIVHFSSVRIIYDDYHNMTEKAFFDANDKPCMDDQGSSKQRYQYDVRGNVIEQTYYDVNDQLVTCSLGYAKIQKEYDNYGNMTEQRFFDHEGKPAYVNMAVGKRIAYYPNGLIKEESFFDESGRLCVNDTWTAIARYEYDANGNLTLTSYFDQDTIPCYEKEYLYSAYKTECDKQNNPRQITFLDTKGQPMYSSQGISMVKFKMNQQHKCTEAVYGDPQGQIIVVQRNTYDERGLTTSETFYDHQNRMIKLAVGYARRTHQYDERGNEVVVALFGADNRPCMGDEEYSRLEKKYNAYSQLIEARYIDDKGKVKHIINQQYDQLGNVTSKGYYDEKGNLKYGRGPAALTLSRYNAGGQLVERQFYNDKRELSSGSNGRPIERFAYNALGKCRLMQLADGDGKVVVNVNYEYKHGSVTRIAFTDSLGKPFVTSVGSVNYGTSFASVRIDYDAMGRELKRTFYNEKNQPFKGKMGYASLVYTYDKKGQRIEEMFLDEKGAPTNDVVGNYCKKVMAYDERGNMVDVSYLDTKGKLAKVPMGVARTQTKYDGMGQCIERTDHEWKDGRWNVKTSYPLREKEERAAQQSSSANYTMVQLHVEKYGQMFEKGFHGRYFVLEWNSWTVYDGIDAFATEFQRTVGQEKRLVLMSMETGEISEAQFTKDLLTARIYDYKNGKEPYDFVTTAYNNWKKNKK